VPFSFTRLAALAQSRSVVRFRLRYRGSDFEVPPGEFLIGRSSECSLSLDDALVSRRHACIHVDAAGATLEDLGSRNGVGVNGERIEGTRKLAHMDRVQVGSHELIVIELSSDLAPRRADPRSATLAGITFDAMMMPPPLRGDSLRGEAQRIAPGSDELTASTALVGVAEKVMALGRYDEAERLLGRWLQDVLSTARAQKSMDDVRAKEVTWQALKLAEGTKRSVWLDWVFEYHEALGVLLGALEIEKVHDLVRKLRYSNVVLVRRYLDAMRGQASGFTPSERFLLSRLEGIERTISA
jgi:FHA domain